MMIRPANSAHGIRIARLPSGDAVPSLVQGTWGMAEDARHRKDEIAALRVGFDLGMTLVDTAEMYADGGAEALAKRSSDVHASFGNNGTFSNALTSILADRTPFAGVFISQP